MHEGTPSQAEQQSRDAKDTNLVKVLEKLHDSIKILHDLSKRTNVPDIQQYAHRQILQRKVFNEELRLALSAGISEPPDGTAEGFLRKLSKDIKSLLPHAESKMLEEVEHSETSLRAAYLEALEDNSASPAIRETLHRHQAHVARAQAELRSLLTHTRIQNSGH